jgi:hypothetical protein
LTGFAAGFAAGLATGLAAGFEMAMMDTSYRYSIYEDL